MKNRIIYLFILPIVLFSCKSSQEPNYKDAHALIVDSFTVSGFVSGIQNLVQFDDLNDSTLYTLEEASQRLLLFKKDRHKPKLFTLSSKVKLPLTPGSFNRLFQGRQAGNGILFYFGDIKAHSVKVMDETGQIISEHQLHHILPHLGNYYNLLDYCGRSLFFKGDTIIASVISDYYPVQEVYKESVFNEFLYNSDTLQYIQSFGRNRGTSAYPNHNPYSLMVNNHIWMLYPFEDTLYQFDVHTGDKSEIAINNLGFTKPDTLHKSGSGHDFSNLNRYNVQNFCYKGMALNKKTGHVALFYSIPMLQTDSNKLLNPVAAPLLAIILNKKGVPLAYYNLGSKQYISIFIAMPKGIAIPKFSNNRFNAESIKFDVFNF